MRVDGNQSSDDGPWVPQYGCARVSAGGPHYGARYTYESPTGSTGNPTSRALTDALFAPMPLLFC